jgi:hypothetical protein
VICHKGVVVGPSLKIIICSFLSGPMSIIASVVSEVVGWNVLFHTNSV